MIKRLTTDKEDEFNKNSGFNKNKSDAINSNDSNTVATSKAVKTTYDKAIDAYNIASGCSYGIGDYWITESTSNPATKWTGTTWIKLEGRVLLGCYALGTQGGRSTVALSLANIAAHTHGISGTANITGNHYHQGDDHRHMVDNHTHSIGTYNAWGSFEMKRDEDNVATVNSATGSFSQSQSGSNRNHSMSSNDGRYRVSDKVQLKTKDGDSGTLGGSSSYTNYQSPNTSTAGDHNNTISGTTGSSGSGSAFNIMNPYRVVNIWRRTA